jgi:hypothetical protein
MADEESRFLQPLKSTFAAYCEGVFNDAIEDQATCRATNVLYDDAGGR